MTHLKTFNWENFILKLKSCMTKIRHFHSSKSEHILCATILIDSIFILIQLANNKLPKDTLVMDFTVCQGLPCTCNGASATNTKWMQGTDAKVENNGWSKILNLA